MSLVKANGAGDQDTGFYNGVATQSARFNGQSEHTTLWRKMGSDPSASRRKAVFSWWMKGDLAPGSPYFWTKGSGGGVADIFSLLLNGERLQVIEYLADSNTMSVISTRLLRDYSAWYHIVWAFDSTQATDTNRVQLFVNGVKQTAFDTSSIPSQNHDHAFGYYQTGNAGSTVERIGGYQGTYTDDTGSGGGTGDANSRFNGYMAEWNYVDGLSFFSDTSGTANSSFNINSFGEFNNGVWIPKAYTGSHGNWGYRLEFKNTSVGSGTSSTVGADTSGNGHHWTSTGLVAADCNRTDSPENNHATLNPLQAVVNDNSTKPTLSDGSLVISTSTADYQGFSSTMAIPTQGKYAFKVKMNTESSTQTHRFGVGTSISGNGIATGNAGNPSEWHSAYVFAATVPRFDTKKDGGSVSTGSTLSATSADDEIEFLVDMDNGTIDTKLNGSAYGTQVTSFPTDKPLFPFGTVYESSSGTSTLTFTFDYTPSDSNYLTLCSANLPELTISPDQTTRAVDHFGTLTYTSDGNSVDIVSGGNDNNGTAVGGEINFSPDWVWIKRRNAANNHQIFDTNRGTNVLVPNENGAESDYSSYFAFLSSSNGFRLPAASANMNANGGTFVAWNWKANGGTTSSNSNGSITSTVQANTDAGFSIVTWTGNATLNSSVGHGLNSAPEIYIIKNRDDNSTNWAVPTTLIDGTHDIGYLNLSNGFGATGVTLPTSSIVYLSSANNQNGSGDDMLMYCFHSVEGFSKFGTYEGNALTDGAFVYLGFRPAWIMIKDADTSGYNWYMYDNTRLGYNPNSIYSLANPDPPAAETNFSGDSVDFLSNGFKLRTSAGGRGTNRGVTYIYFAFAETPFKFANAR